MAQSIDIYPTVLRYIVVRVSTGSHDLIDPYAPYSQEGELLPCDSKPEVPRPPLLLQKQL